MNSQIRVGDCFPSEDSRSVALARFLVAGQTLHSYARLDALVRQQDGKDAYDDAKLALMLGSIGALREMAKAFEEIKKEGWLEELHERIEGFDEATRRELPQRLRRLSRELDYSDDESLLRKFLKPARDQTIFHYDADSIREALSRASSEHIQTIREQGSNSRVIDSSIPLASALPMAVLRGIAGKENLDSVVSLVAKVQGDVIHLMQALYQIHLSNRGISLPGPSSADDDWRETIDH